MSEALTPREEDVALAAEYVLDLLEGGELATFEARLAVEPGLRALVARWTEDLVAFAEEIEPVTPGWAVETAIMDRLFPEPPRPSPWRRLGLLPALLGGAVAAAAVLWVLEAGVFRPGAPEPDYAARIASEDGSLVVLASFDPESRRLEVETTEGTPPEGRVLELWLIAGEEVRSLGVVPEAGPGVIEVREELAAAFEGASLAVSDEPPGGSPTGQATGSVLAVGTVDPL